MGLIANGKTKKNLDPVPADTYRAVCYAIYDIGTHVNPVFKSKNHQVIIIWELPDLLMDYEKDGVTKQMPRVISKTYTLSLGEKAILRRDLQSWRGRVFTEEELDGFDIKNLLGANGLLQVIVKKKEKGTFAEVSTIMPLMKGMQKVEPATEKQFYSMQDGMDIPENTPKWIREKILSSLEFTGKSGSADEAPPIDTSELPPDECPF